MIVWKKLRTEFKNLSDNYSIDKGFTTFVGLITFETECQDLAKISDGEHIEGKIPGISTLKFNVTFRNGSFNLSYNSLYSLETFDEMSFRVVQCGNFENSWAAFDAATEIVLGFVTKIIQLTGYDVNELSKYQISTNEKGILDIKIQPKAKIEHINIDINIQKTDDKS